jgi:hypothetical protein
LGRTEQKVAHRLRRSSATRTREGKLRLRNRLLHHVDAFIEPALVNDGVA